MTCGNGQCDSFEQQLTCPDDCYPQALRATLARTAEYDLWHADATIKLLPTMRAPSASIDHVTLPMARNETRVFQLAFTADGVATVPVRLETRAADLQARWYEEALITVTSQPSRIVGPIPDALLPPAPVSLREDSTTALLFEVTTDKVIEAGLHPTALAVTVGDTIVSVDVFVYDLEVPDELPLKTAFDSGHFTARYGATNPPCSGRSVCDFHDVSDSSYAPLVSAYYEDYAFNRIAPYSPQHGREFTYDCGTKQFDFTEFDLALTHYIDELHMNAVMLGHYPTTPASDYPLCGKTITDPDYADVAIPYYQGLDAHLRDKGWLDKSYFMVDEPDADVLVYSNTLAGIVTANTSLRIGPAANRWFTGFDNANLWILVDTVYDSMSLDDIDALRDRGVEIWWYYISGPQFDIDSTSMDAMMPAWSAFHDGIRGLLGWAGLIFDTQCMGNGTANPWADPRSPWGNGQTNFYYPPCGLDLFSTPTYEVVPSLRVKLIREGLQDHAYLTLLTELIEEATQAGVDVRFARAVLARVGEITFGAGRWAEEPATIVGLRREVAEAVEQLQR